MDVPIDGAVVVPTLCPELPIVPCCTGAPGVLCVLVCAPVADVCAFAANGDAANPMATIAATMCLVVVMAHSFGSCFRGDQPFAGTPSDLTTRRKQKCAASDRPARSSPPHNAATASRVAHPLGAAGHMGVASRIEPAVPWATPISKVQHRLRNAVAEGSQKLSGGGSSKVSNCGRRSG